MSYDQLRTKAKGILKYRILSPYGTLHVGLQRLPGRKITDAEVLSDDALKLSFDNGDTVTLLRTDPRYESVTIDTPNGSFIVIM